jgi:hypothetical protein
MSRVEIRTYEGSGEDLADLVCRTWYLNYAGRMWFPVWDFPYFKWRLLDDRIESRDFFVCAYEGTKLVGCLMAEPLDFEIRGQRLKGTLSSWLSVDPAVAGPVIALRLVEGLRKRHLEHHMALSIGCTGSNSTLPTRRFWDSLERRNPADFHNLGPMRFWTRVFDFQSVAAAGLSWFERVGPKIGAYLPWDWIATRNASGIRSYQRADLPRCQAWLQAQADGADIKIVWSAQRLNLQLGHPTYPRTLMTEDASGKGAFLNYYPIGISGKSTIRTAIIDLIAGDISFEKKLALIHAAIRQMKSEGIQMALMMRSMAAPAWPLLAAGFIPVPAHQKLFSYFMSPQIQRKPSTRLHIIFS